MRSTILAVLITLAMSTSHGADSSTTTTLEKIHAAWFTAFDSGDGAAMDKVEMDNLALGMPDGSFWYKKEPRAPIMKPRKAEDTRSLNDVVVREFGDTAILTGVLVTKHGADTELAGTTVVFVKKSGAWKIASANWTDRKS